ncbi:hypothetical protein CR513_33816, partial [Mucuna pruriens]
MSLHGYRRNHSGHLVSIRGIEVDKEKFNFIKDFSKIALPLAKLLQKHVEFLFDQPCEDAFQELKKRLTSTPILQAPN